MACVSSVVTEIDGNKADSAPAIFLQSFTPMPSFFKPLCHPRVDSVSNEVNTYFLQHWSFPNEKAKKKFLDAGFSRVTCLYFPLALDDRIHFACRLLTVLFLIDGKSEA